MGSKRKKDKPEAEPVERERGTISIPEYDAETGLTQTTIFLPDLGLPDVSGNTTDNVAIDREEIIAHIRSYLDAMVGVRSQMAARDSQMGDWAFNSIEDLLQQRGTFLPPARFTSIEKSFLIRTFAHYDEPARLGDCYQVATDLTMHAQWLFSSFSWGPGIWSVRYGEGLAMAHNSVLPVGHAVMLLNEKPVDIVWRPEMGNDARRKDEDKSLPTFMRRANWCAERNVYLMLPVESHVALNYITAKESYGILDDWKNRWPFVRLGPERAATELVLDRETKPVV